MGTKINVQTCRMTSTGMKFTTKSKYSVTNYITTKLWVNSDNSAKFAKYGCKTKKILWKRRKTSNYTILKCLTL